MVNLKLTGSGLIVAGIVSFVLQVLTVTYHPEDAKAFYIGIKIYGPGFLAGAFFVAAGIAAIIFAVGSADSKRSSLKKNIFSALTPISIFFSIHLIAITSMVISHLLTPDNPDCESKSENFCYEQNIINSLLVSAGVVAFVLSAMHVTVICTFFAGNVD